MTLTTPHRQPHPTYMHQFGWITATTRSACLVVVTGEQATIRPVLDQFRADRSGQAIPGSDMFPTRWHDRNYFGACPVAGETHAILGWEIPAYPTARPHLVQQLSTHGKVAAVAWQLGTFVRISLAEHGNLITMIDTDSSRIPRQRDAGTYRLPSDLLTHPLLATCFSDREMVSMGLEWVRRFTGVTVSAAELAGMTTLYPLTA